MVTTPEEYNKFLYRIQSENAPSLAILLPTDEKIYNIDANARTIEGPDTLSIETDHRAETIYFKINRYADHVDLSTTVCLIQYINAQGEGRIYPVPFYDVDTYAETNEMLLPWVVDGDVAIAAGDISYSFRFYKMDGNDRIVYDFNTVPARSKILSGIKNKSGLDAELEDRAASALEDIYSKIDAISRYDLYWDDWS